VHASSIRLLAQPWDKPGISLSNVDHPSAHRSLALTPFSPSAKPSHPCVCSFPPSVQAPPPPPRGSGFDPAQPEELELWQLHQGLAREREYHHVAKRKAGTYRCSSTAMHFVRVPEQSWQSVCNAMPALSRI